MTSAHPALHTLYVWNHTADQPVATARQHLQTALLQRGVVGEPLDDALVMVSELVTNALNHASGPYQLRLRTASAEHIVEIHDRSHTIPELPSQSSTWPAAPVPSDRGGGTDALLERIFEHGRGLQIVHQLSRGSWGFRTRPGGKVAWFALGLERREEAPM
jgi:hypothetical protein